MVRLASGLATISLALTLTAVLAGHAPTAHAAELITGGDLFDVDRGTTVTSNSAVDSSVIEAMFGAPGGGPESGNTFFADAPAGTVHFVEWSTAQPVALAGFNVHASGDLPGQPEKRVFNHFRLQAKVGDTFQTLYDEDVTVPYVFLDGQLVLVISSPVDPITAQEFRAEFTQHLEGSFFGPRIYELDGFPDGSCADPNYNGATSASDALSALKASVGSIDCPLCICDVDSSGATTASDALAILRSSVGQSVTLTCPACFLLGTTTTSSPPTTHTTLPATTSSTTSTTVAPATSSTTSTSVLSPTTTVTTTTTLPLVDCDIDVSECTTVACSCGEASGLDYHLVAEGDASGPVGTEVRVNISAPAGGTIDCGDWTRIFGATVTGCDIIGCCRRESGEPETTHWSTDAIELPCICPSSPEPVLHNYLVQCQLRPGPVKEVEETTVPCT